MSNPELVQKHFPVYCVLRAAEELCLTDLLEYIEDHLLNNTDELLNHFALIYKFATQDEHYKDFTKLQEFCLNAMEREPSIVFDSTDFINIDQDSLISLLQMRYLIRREIELWDKIVEWSIAQVPYLSLIIENWSPEDFSIFGNIISPFIPYINFSLIRPNEFASKVRIFRRSFGDECYAKLLELHLSQLDIVTATLFQSSQDINSTLITPKHAALICSWLTNDEEYQSYNIPFEFNLLVRGSRDGFGPKIFHEKCDLKGPTITILKVLHSDELLGGYNPLNWEAHPEGAFHKTNKSFIFSLGQDDKHSSNLSLTTIHSKVKETKKAIFQYEDYGPCFASDLALVGNYKGHWEGHCLKKNYENRISPGNYVFYASDYEVFQIVRKFL
ncbi:3940_t:CDS:2 [Funneliformis caledonium]|uniref:3940_t:CDS:1 n=1 Tax=Funneliformis caledonium TaxID=1117310 RepID=A0A9N8VTU2_9GLOM|nr:3940_t:CDS:2 [Funneliformis caledonium]